MSSIKYHPIVTAIIYDKKGRILSIGQNNYDKTHPLMLRYGKNQQKKLALHAEIDAIIRCRNLDRAHRIRVFSITKSGVFRNAKPCEICMEGITRTPIKIIEYSTRESDSNILKI